MSDAPRRFRPGKEYKVILVGDPCVGKTAFVRRFVANQFDPSYKATLGVEYSSKVVEISRDLQVKVNLWDVVGQERFRAMTRAFYKGACGAFVLFDVTDEETFGQVVTWKKDIDEKVSLPSGRPIPCLLLANKIDLEAKVSDDTLQQFAEDHKFFAHVKTSVKKNTNIEVAVSILIKEMLRLDKEGFMRDAKKPEGSESTIMLTSNPSESTSISCPC
ncbi:ras-related protein Rab-7L1-like [Corticium candelabrum]|uniref:ras-related protein Rab-7L1-like n=1 Tax=Corticium candelabrum TaxID=121492 RepID=UPI002E35D1DD|nr:ras-related protein Rab-7L1-like [Corticium candelabrum]